MAGTPIDAERVRALTAASPWPAPILLATTGSTNADAGALAAQGAPEGASVLADEQTAGRGRMGRAWTSRRGSGLWMSVVLRPGDQPRARWGWLPLLVGLAARDAVGGVHCALKWPNDLLCGSAKLGGILLEGAGTDAVVAGIGINVLPVEGLPEHATCLVAEGGAGDREALLASMLSSLRTRLEQWRGDPDALEADYRAACATLGRRVEVSLVSGEQLTGVAAAIDAEGALLVDVGTPSLLKVSAGDVVHATI